MSNNRTSEAVVEQAVALTDGNGRVSRLVMNTFLYQDKLFPVSIPVLRRADYYNVLERNKSADFGNYIADLELQTLIMRFLHIEYK